MKNSKQSLLSYELELYKQVYDEENNYRNQFSDRVFKTITVIVSIIGALIWLIVNFSSIYKNQCCYVRCVNCILLVVCFFLSALIVIYFFKILYGYKETRQMPEDIYNLIEGYKLQTSDEGDIIETVKISLAKSYIDAAIKNSKENEQRIDMFITVYKFILVDIVVIATTFLLEVFLQQS